MRLRLALFALFCASSAFAVQPEFWRVGSPDELLGGEVEGMTVNSRGELKAGTIARKIATFTEPFVLSQARDGKGNRFFGTGNEGKVYRLSGRELKLLYTAPEPEIYALTFHQGALYVGTSPNGKVYRVDPANGAASIAFDPKQAYIWSLLSLEGGDLAVATGVEGKLFRVDAKGHGNVWFDAPEPHLRSMAMSNGRLLAGGSGEGRIYELIANGTARALYDSPLTEISAIHADPVSGLAWAAGVSNVAPQTPPPPRSDPQKSSPQQSDATQVKKDDQPTVDLSISFDDFSPPPVPSSGSAELYRIDPDGFVEVIRRFDRELVYAIAGDATSLYLSTGPLGRVYELRNKEIALLATIPEKQVVSFVKDATGSIITTTNSGAVYELDSRLGSEGEYRSMVKDTERFSRLGQFKVEGTALEESSLVVSFRSGNTSAPDETWSAWVSVPGTNGTAAAPAARYFQWKLKLEKPNERSAVDAVTVSFMNRNVAPVIESVVVHDPGAVYISSSYPAAPQVVEATNPDEYGIFTSIDTAKERMDPGKKFFRKGYRTVQWKAHDDNEDDLRYTISFRRSGEPVWLRLRENLEETQINFDTSQFPDGRYELRLVASDHPDNPEQPLNDLKEQIEFAVDNISPRIEVTSEGDDFVIRITDALSPVGKVEYAINAQKWIRLLPTDGIADSSSETFRLKKSEIGGGFAVIRAVDSFHNVATASVK